MGYTNAGKSTLLNRLTRSEVVAENKLFATLDSSSRRLRFPRERDVIITDTVGFIRDLPPDLVAGFRSTLEEIRDARVLLHVVDAADPNAESHIAVVRQMLGELGLGEIPELLILNKCDKLDGDVADELVADWKGIPISAQTGDGIEAMLYSLGSLLFEGALNEAPIAAGGA